MATTRLTEVVEPTTFTTLAQLLSLRKSVFFQTGITVSNGLLSARAAANEGGVFNLPRFNPLSDNEPNSSSDDPNETATPDNIDQVDQVAVKLRRNNGWSSMDLVAALNAGPDPMSAVANDVAGYWARAIDISQVSCMKGWTDQLEASFAGEIVYTIADTEAATLGNEIVRARGLMGDRADELSTLLVTGRVNTTLNEQNLIDFIPDARGETMFGMYQGMRLVVTDSITPNSGSGAGVHTGYMTVPGAILYGEGNPKTPTEVRREPDRGNGEGEEILWNRRHYVNHMDGISFAGTITNGKTPANSGLATAATWQVQYSQRKRYPVVRIDFTYV